MVVKGEPAINVSSFCNRWICYVFSIHVIRNKSSVSY